MDIENRYPQTTGIGIFIPAYNFVPSAWTWTTQKGLEYSGPIQIWILYWILLCCFSIVSL